MTREKAQELIHAMKKILLDGFYYLPTIGNMNDIPLESVQSTKDHFTIYVNRKSTIVHNKYTLLLHFPEENLIRIDVNGPPHVNPDGEIIPCPHIHLRQKNVGKWDQWAFELPAIFGDSEDCISTVRDFLHYCNVNNISELTLCEQKEFNDEATGD